MDWEPAEAPLAPPLPAEGAGEAPDARVAAADAAGGAAAHTPACTADVVRGAARLSDSGGTAAAVNLMAAGAFLTPPVASALKSSLKRRAPASAPPGTAADDAVRSASQAARGRVLSADAQPCALPVCAAVCFLQALARRGGAGRTQRAGQERALPAHRRDSGCVGRQLRRSWPCQRNGTRNAPALTRPRRSRARRGGGSHAARHAKHVRRVRRGAPECNAATTARADAHLVSLRCALALRSTACAAGGAARGAPAARSTTSASRATTPRACWLQRCGPTRTAARCSRCETQRRRRRRMTRRRTQQRAPPPRLTAFSRREGARGSLRLRLRCSGAYRRAPPRRGATNA